MASLAVTMQLHLEPMCAKYASRNVTPCCTSGGNGGAVCRIGKLKMELRHWTACLLATLVLATLASTLPTGAIFRDFIVNNWPTTLVVESAPQGAVQPQLIVCSETTTRPQVVVSTSTMVIPRTSVALPVWKPLDHHQVLNLSTIWAATTFPSCDEDCNGNGIPDADEIAGGAAFILSACLKSDLPELHLPQQHLLVRMAQDCDGDGVSARQLGSEAH